MLIIGISGFIGSGKNTVTKFLVNEFDFKQLSWASAAKDAISVIFGWDRNLLEGDTDQSREWRDIVDPWWANRLSIPNLTPRWVLQNFATDVCRNSFHQDIWIASLENKIRNSTKNIVISDCRFKNEIDTIKKNKGFLFWVRKNQLPEWYNDYYNHDIEKIKKWNIHNSETDWIGTDFDAIIYNNDTLDKVHNDVRNIVEKIILNRKK